MKKKNWIMFGVMIAIFVVVLTLDLTTKYVFEDRLSDGEAISIIPFLFNFKLVYNYGAAWGFLQGKQLFLIVLSLIFILIFVIYYIKEPKKTWLLNISYGFIFAGCLGNLFDRIFFGCVRDFIQFDFWKSFPIFNFADVALFVGVVLFLVYLLVYFLKNRKTIVIEKPKDEDKND